MIKPRINFVILTASVLLSTFSFAESAPSIFSRDEQAPQDAPQSNNYSPLNAISKQRDEELARVQRQLQQDTRSNEQLREEAMQQRMPHHADGKLVRTPEDPTHNPWSNNVDQQESTKRNDQQDTKAQYNPWGKGPRDSEDRQEADQRWQAQNDRDVDQRPGGSAIYNRPQQGHVEPQKQGNQQQEVPNIFR